MGGLADRGADGGDGGVEELELLQVLVPHPVQGHPPPPTPAGSGVTGLHRRLTPGFALLEGRRSAPPRRAWGRGGWVRNDSGRRSPARRVQNTPGSAPDTTPDRPGARRAPKRRFAGNGWWSRLPRWRQKGKPSQAGRQGRTGRRAGAGGAWGLAPWAIRRLKTPIRRPSSPPKETAPFAPRAINCPWERVVLKNSEHPTGAAGRVLSPGVSRGGPCRSTAKPPAGAARRPAPPRPRTPRRRPRTPRAGGARGRVSSATRTAAAANRRRGPRHAADGAGARAGVLRGAPGGAEGEGRRGEGERPPAARASSVPAGGGAAGPDAAALQAVQYWVDNRPYDDRRNVSVIVLPDGQLGVGIEAVPIKPKFAKV